MTHDVVYRAFMKVNADRFDSFYQDILSPMIQATPYRIISGDGQAIRATGLSEKEDSSASDRAYMLMNFYDSTNHVCLAQKLIAKKTNEITGSSSKTPVAKPNGTKMFCSVFLNDVKKWCFFAIKIV